MIRPPWCEPDWDVMEENCQVTLIVDIPSLQDWSLSVCPWADWRASAWNGAALMAKVINDRWGGDFEVSFTKWAGDTVAEIHYPTGGRDPDDDEGSLLADVKSRTDGAAFSARRRRVDIGRRTVRRHLASSQWQDGHDAPAVRHGTYRGTSGTLH